MNPHPVLPMSSEHQLKILAARPGKWSTLRSRVYTPGVYQMCSGRAETIRGNFFEKGTTRGNVELLHRPPDEQLEIVAMYDRAAADRLIGEPILLITWADLTAAQKDAISISEGYGIWRRDRFAWDPCRAEFEVVAEAFYPGFISARRPLYLHWLQQVTA